MKTFFKFIFTISVFGLMAFKAVEYVIEKQEPIQVLSRKEIVLVPVKLEVPKLLIKTYSHNDFLNDLGYYESGNKYNIKNKYGYLGRYQFHISTLKALGINTTKKAFLNDPDLQEEAMQRLMLDNYKSLKRYIKKYDGKVLYGVYVTKSGVLAAAHLGGAGNVRNWFRKGENFADANGTKITKYMKIFSGYKLDI